MVWSGKVWWALVCCASVLMSCSNTIEVGVVSEDPSIPDAMESDDDEPEDVDESEDVDGPEDADEEIVDDAVTPDDVAEGDDVDGVEDEDASEPCVTAYVDEDGDGFGLSDAAQEVCGELEPGWSLEGGDCDDEDPYSHPGAIDICDGRDNDCVGGPDQYGCQCEPFRVGNTASAYTLCTDRPMNWIDARRFCQAQGGDLAVVKSAEVNGGLWQKIEGAEGFNDRLTQTWLGMEDFEEEGLMRWVDGTEVAERGDPEAFNIWNGDSEPNDAGPGEDCGEIYQAGWNDRRCSSLSDFICEVRLDQLPLREACADGEPPGEFHRDLDGDGFGDRTQAVVACQAPPGFVAASDVLDCAVDDPLVYPTRLETCNGRDDNCNDAVDEDCRCEVRPGPDGHQEYLLCTETQIRERWFAAAQKCVQRGYQLAHIEGDRETFFVMQELQPLLDEADIPNRSPWLGLKFEAEHGAEPRWLYGLPVRVPRWRDPTAFDAPSDCAILINSVGNEDHLLWGVKPCIGEEEEQVRPFICKKGVGAPPWKPSNQ